MQRAQLSRTAGVCRFIWNSALAYAQGRYEKGAKHPGFAELCRDLTVARNDPDLAFLREVHSKPQQQVLKDLTRAFSDFFSRKKGYPRFKRKGVHDSFRHPERVSVSGNKVVLPGLGTMRFIKSREILGVIKNATISRDGEHWFVSLQTEREVVTPSHPSRTAVGIDLGVARFATLSNGEFFRPLDAFRGMEAQLARSQRSLARKKKFSKNWHKQKDRLNRIHRRIRNARADYLHKASSSISKSHAVVALEDLKIRNMSATARGDAACPGKNVRAKSGLNKAILDQGWYEFKRQLAYKLKWQGGHLFEVEPAYTSQECNACGHTHRDNRKTQELFECVSCAHQAHADVNAARNILVRAGRAQSACQGGPLKAPFKQEPLGAASAA